MTEPIGAQVDPRDLTRAELDALRIVDTCRLARHRNGWRAGASSVTLAMIDRLTGKGLVARRIIAGRYQIKVTGTGRNTLVVADYRKVKVA